MSSTILNEISDVLNDIEKYWTNENLAKQIIIEDLRNNDTKLISKLLSSEIINEIYVQDIDGYKIFDKEAFISMLRYKNYWMDSYTKYANKIGLTAEGKYLNYNSDVVLDFPFKDCILEGGMAKEDSILKNDEKFYNEVIAKEEIDTLLSPKAFKNMKKFDVKGFQNIDHIDFTENLIIKGNNLVTLHSLKEKYKASIKLIYIDPPYNTGNDEFQYNDRFNHASWLTFMKNRLEIAKELLTEEGVIMISIDDSEQAELKLLCDEIFKKNNFLANLIWNLKTGTQAGHFTRSHEYILTYAKNKNRLPNFKGGSGVIDHSALKKIGSKNPASEFTFPKGIRFEAPDGTKLNNKWGGSESVTLIDGEMVAENGKLASDVTLKAGWAMKSQMLKWLNGEDTYDSKGQKVIEFYFNSKGILKYKKEKSIVNPKTILEDAGSTKNGTSHLYELFNGETLSFPKTEKLISKLINYTTSEGDIILDFFMGSGTTQSVAHKMNRQYIGIEQMNYINTVSIPRLQKVVEGEQGGISTEVDWQGGGSFVYAELAKENQEIVESIINCDNKEELNHQINKLLNNGVLNYEVDFDKFTSTKKEFSELELEDQKEVLIRILDNNQLYVNYSDIEDFAYNFTEDEIAFNHSFYGGE
ncbi:DNA methyltransferase [Staphylococcus epidermidis]|uniref:DNA methyltransferase n=1 Tax=Staphylococcus epidermidis TaxID=1282 RepID=UPI00066AF78B|nr:site-specific DNA-methyltransferase [Staphylococcus epidermidis]MCO6228574.1 site-specific DNA-methyltransferase [Staphylococcus epidermidis]MCO6241937.1 site-specific DNA-methyltransferase [Staphylococcus epidermidis]